VTDNFNSPVFLVPSNCSRH